MSVVIRRKNGDVLWFDAVLSFESQFTSTVTKHPIATGGFISDHTTNNNVVLNVAGVLSDADFNLQRPVVSTVGFVDNEVITTGRDKQFTNSAETRTPVQIEDGNTVNKFLPGIIAQFTKDSIPTVTVTPQDKVRTAADVRIALNDMWSSREEFQVIDIIDEKVRATFGPCIFTSLSYREDETTGTGIFPVMQIEEVTFTDVRMIQVQIKNKGRKAAKSTTQQDTPKSTGNGGNAETQPTTYSDQSSLSVIRDQRRAEGATGG